MRNQLAILVLFSLMFSFASSAWSAECACRLMPMYPVDATNWFHYGTINRTGTSGCTTVYPTGIIGAPAYGQSCSSSPGTCGTCSTLGVGDIVANFELYYGVLNQDPAIYETLDEEAEIKTFFKSNIPSGADPALYDDHTFSRPFPCSYSKPIVVKLTRNVASTTETFYAIVWRMNQTVGSVQSTVGIEISGEPPAGVSILAPCCVCNAVSPTVDGSGTASHNPIPGLLQVQFSCSKDDIAFIRLQNSDKNRTAGYKSCKP